jgi:hypothetical protein
MACAQEITAPRQAGNQPLRAEAAIDASWSSAWSKKSCSLFLVNARLAGDCWCGNRQHPSRGGEAVSAAEHLDLEPTGTIRGLHLAGVVDEVVL